MAATSDSDFPVSPGAGEEKEEGENQGGEEGVREREETTSEPTEDASTIDENGGREPEEVPAGTSSPPPAPSSFSAPSELSEDGDGGMPSFLTALNLKPRAEVEKRREDAASDGEADASPQAATLSEKFKQDPSAVIDLLQAAMSVDKLASLIKNQYHSDKSELDNLQETLEGAYSVLKECQEKKEELNGKVEEANEKIKVKRKHLEELREELRVLGDEEVQLKKRRDASYGRFMELKKKIQSSRDALQQIATLSNTTDSN